VAKEEKELKGMDAWAWDYEREPVPEMKKKSWWSSGLIFGGVAACLAALMVGGIVGSMLNLSDALIAIVCGCLVTTVIAAVTAAVAARINLSTPMISRFAFGDWGVVIVALVLALGCYGWFAVQLGLFGETARASIGLITGVTPGTVGLWLAIIFGGLAMISSAIFGYKSIAWLSYIAVVPIVGIMIASVVVVLGTHPWGELLMHAPPNPAPIAIPISIIAGGFMVGAVIAPDVSRYAKSTGHAVGGVLLGFLAFQIVLIFMGAILAHAANEWDAVKIMLGLGWGILGMLVLVLAQWTTNDNNLYSAALSFAVIFRRWPRWWLTLGAGVIGILLALWGIYGQFPNWLMFLGVLIPPIAGIYVADYFITNREFYKFENLPKVAKVRWLMLATWVVSSFIGLCTTPAGAAPGALGWFKITTIPAIDTFLVSFVLAIIVGWAYKKVKGGWPEATPA
jgi:cytosine permease